MPKACLISVLLLNFSWSEKKVSIFLLFQGTICQKLLFLVKRKVPRNNLEPTSGETQVTEPLLNKILPVLSLYQLPLCVSMWDEFVKMAWSSGNHFLGLVDLCVDGSATTVYYEDQTLHLTICSESKHRWPVPKAHLSRRGAIPPLVQNLHSKWISFCDTAWTYHHPSRKEILGAKGRPRVTGTV